MKVPAPTYEIRISGYLSTQWANWFEGFDITLEEDGNTLLSGPVADQSALHGALAKVRDMGMPLVSISQAPIDASYRHQAKEQIMNTTANPTLKIEPRVLLSTLWIVVLINMLKADVLSLNIPGAAEEVARTAASTGATIPLLMLVGAIIGNLAIAMIVLSHVLPHGAGRWANVVMAVVTIAYIWGGAASYPHYIFIAAIETAYLLLIIWIAWKWLSADSLAARAPQKLSGTSS